MHYATVKREVGYKKRHGKTDSSKKTGTKYLYPCGSICMLVLSLLLNILLLLRAWMSQRRVVGVDLFHIRDALMVFYVCRKSM